METEEGMRIGENVPLTGKGQAAALGLRLASVGAIGGSLSYERPVSLNTAAFSGQCSVGYMTYVGPGSRIAMADIGRYCSIAPGVAIGASEHPLNWVSTHPFQYDGTKQFQEYEEYGAIVGKNSFQGNTKRTIIGNDVLIGDGAFIKRGVSVGNGAVIGARAVVTKDVAPYSIVAGNPARVVSGRFGHDVTSRMLATEWWRYDLADFEPSLFKDPEHFIDALERARLNGHLRELQTSTYHVSGGANPEVKRLG